MMDAFDTVIHEINAEFDADLCMYTGIAPVQVWGSVGDKFAYFRYRGQHWSLEVVPTEDDLFQEGKAVFQSDGKFGEPHQGWLEPKDLGSFCRIV